MAGKKESKSKACKHKFVQPVYYNADNNDYDSFHLKCSWCYQKFNTPEDLEKEYQRLNVPYKKVSIERYKEWDPFQPDYDPTKPKTQTKADLYLRGKDSQSRGNKTQYSSYRWGYRQ